MQILDGSYFLTAIFLVKTLTWRRVMYKYNADRRSHVVDFLWLPRSPFRTCHYGDVLFGWHLKCLVAIWNFIFLHEVPYIYTSSIQTNVPPTVFSVLGYCFCKFVKDKLIQTETRHDFRLFLLWFTYDSLPLFISTYLYTPLFCKFRNLAHALTLR